MKQKDTVKVDFWQREKKANRTSSFPPMNLDHPLKQG